MDYEGDGRRRGGGGRFILGLLTGALLFAAGVVAMAFLLPLPERQVSAPAAAVEPPPPPAFSERPFDAPPGSEVPIAAEPVAETPSAPAPVPEAPVELPLITLDGPALEVNAVAFEAPADTPLLSVVLEYDPTIDLPAETLLALSVPLTLAIAPDSEAELVMANEAQAAGYEVLTLVDMSGAGAQPVMPGLDIATLRNRVEPKLAFLQMSVGAMNRDGNRATADPAFVRDLLTVLGTHGFGLIENRGPGQEVAGAVAAELGAPFARRGLAIPSGANFETILQTLDSAAAMARETGTTVVVGRATRDTLRGVLIWSLQDQGRAVRLAPVSAVLKRRAQP